MPTSNDTPTTKRSQHYITHITKSQVKRVATEITSKTKGEMATTTTLTTLTTTTKQSEGEEEHSIHHEEEEDNGMESDDSHNDSPSESYMKSTSSTDTTMSKATTKKTAKARDKLHRQASFRKNIDKGGLPVPKTESQVGKRQDHIPKTKLDIIIVLPGLQGIRR